MNKLQTCLLLNLILLICCQKNVSDIQRTEFFTHGKYSIVAMNEDIPEVYRSEVYFDGTSLIIDSSGINVILVQKNLTPFFEVCGANLPVTCPETFALYYASDGEIEANLFCPNSLGVIGYSNDQIRSMKARLFKFTSPCTQFFVKPDPEWETDKLYAKLPKGNFQKISPIYRILRQLLINSSLDKAYEQISLRVSGNYCGKPLRFPEAYLAIVKPPPPEEPSTTTPIPTTTTVSTTLAIVKLSTTKNSKSTTEEISNGTGFISWHRSGLDSWHSGFDPHSGFIAYEENCGKNSYKINAFCVCAFPLPDQTMGTWPPDYVENMAVRASTIEQRGIWHLQVVTTSEWKLQWYPEAFFFLKYLE